MQEMSKNLKLANMVVGQQVARQADLVVYASALVDAPFGDLFPAGTGPDVVDTGGKEGLWKDPEGFARAVRGYRERASGFKAASESGDVAAERSALQDLGDACSDCHDRYRMEDG